MITSREYRNIGLVQFVLATGFVIWLVFLPGLAPLFAWAINDQLTAMFIGTAFALRAFEGYFMWREPNWYRLRWMGWGTMGFLVIIFLATYIHVQKMNWVPLNLAAIVWFIAYTLEPLMLPFYEPRGADANADVPQSHQRGALRVGLQTILDFVMIVSITLGGLLFIAPEFTATVWPWAVPPFSARVMAAFFIGITLWAAKIKLSKDWSEVRMGIQGLILFFAGHFIVWIFNLATAQYDLARVTVWVYGIGTGVFALGLTWCYWQQEK